MEEDLIDESAFEVKETDQYTQRASAKSFTNVSNNNKKHRQPKVKATRRRRSLLGQRREWKFR